MQDNNIRRIKNILDGNYTAPNSISAGYEKDIQEHNEGDVWEDSNGKKFIKKNGIIKSYSKLSAIRNLTKMPLVCPQCGQAMTIWQDEKMWKSQRKCFSCVVNEDNQRIIDGTQKQYAENKIKQNKKSWLDDIEVACLDAVDGIESKSFITELGDIEDWSGGKLDKNKLRENVKEQIKDLKQKLDI